MHPVSLSIYAAILAVTHIFFDRRLILCGDADRMTPVKYSQFLAAEMPDARLIILPGAGHMAMLEPSPRLIVVDAIARFVETLR